MQFKNPQGSTSFGSWEVKGKVSTATNSNCETPAGSKILEWQSSSNSQEGEMYAVAVLLGRYQVSNTAKAYVRISSGCCYYKSPNGTTFGIECLPDPLCSVDDPTVVGTQCNTQYPVTLKIAEYENASKYQNNTFTDGQDRLVTESYTIAWYRYTGGNPASGTLLGSGWTLNYTPVAGSSVTPIITKTQSYQNYSGNTVSQSCASGAVTPQITNTIVTFTPQVTNPDCFGGDATINVSTSGTYSYKLGGSAGTPVTFPYTIGVSGNYTLYALDAISGCDTTKTFIVNIPTDVTLGGTPTNVTCNGGSDGSVTLSAAGGVGNYEYKKGSGAWQSSATFGSLSAGSYTFTVKDGNGCEETYEVTITEPVKFEPTATGDEVCEDETINLSASAGSSFSWTGPGSFTSTDQNPIISNASSADAGTYTVTVTNANGCIGTADATVVVNSKPSKPTITADKLVCLGTSTTLSGTPSGGVWNIVSGGGSLAGNVYTAPLTVSDIAAVISYTVTNDKGCNNDNQVTIQFADCSNFCTYSQGYYGNPGGKSCRVIPGEGTSYTTEQESTIERIRRAFANYKAANGGATSVKFGVGDKSFNLRESDLNDTYVVKSKLGEMEKIFALLPGGGTAMVINARSGGGWNSDNGALAGGPLRTQPNNSIGKIKNALLAQTVAMWINMWASQNDLGDWEMPATFSTYDAQACGSSIPAPGATENKFTTPGPLAGKTVKELLELANRALAGETIGGGINGSMIHGMLGKLVDAFHGCKTFAGVPEGISGGARIEFGGPAITTASEVTVKEEIKSDVVVKAFPNPYVDQVVFNISVKNAGKGSLVLYNAVGQKVANVFEGDMQANSTQTIRYSVPVSQRKSLVYVFRQNGNTSTGRLVSGK